jgi:hypothetical protein
MTEIVPLNPLTPRVAVIFAWRTPGKGSQAVHLNVGLVDLSLGVADDLSTCLSGRSRRVLSRVLLSFVDRESA